MRRRTIERWFDGWVQSGVDSLQMVPGRGVKTRLKGYEDEVAKQVEINGRNLKNVLTYFEEEHKITICKKTLQNFLKGTGLYLETNQTIAKDLSQFSKSQRTLVVCAQKCGQTIRHYILDTT